MSIEVTVHPSPLGELTLAVEQGALCGLWLAGQRGAPSPSARPRTRSFDPVRAQLDAYFSGRRRRFELVLRPRGTPFQLAVWRALLDIPFGATQSYGELAARLGRPSAARAVGSANGSNPISIVVPCHRVIGRDGDLRGYAGGEPRKRWLLDHEHAIAQAPAGVGAGPSPRSP